MRRLSRTGGRSVLLTAAAALMLTGSAFGQVGGPDPCIVDDDFSGTVHLPPPGCEYLSPDEFHEIRDGLPAGTTIELDPIHFDFFCLQGPNPVDCEIPGGVGFMTSEQFDSTLRLNMQGTGDLSGFSRSLDMNMTCVTGSGPRDLFDTEQTFWNVMLSCQGSIVGDPDFDSLTIRAGSDFGLPSSGSTTLTLLPPDGITWQVDSFFDITYTIDYVGSPGGALNGATGSDQFTIRMEAQAADPFAGGIPTVSEWGLMGMTVLLVGAGAVVIRRRRLAVA